MTALDEYEVYGIELRRPPPRDFEMVEDGCALVTRGDGAIVFIVASKRAPEPGGLPPTIPARWRDQLRSFCGRHQVPWMEPRWRQVDNRS